MLSSLHIENIAVIKRLELDLGGGFIALTGETGAGKSVIIDSIGLILGDKTDRGIIRSGEDSACVSAVFTGIDSAAASSLAEFGVPPDEDGSLMLWRRITSDGRSSCRINGRGVTISVLRGAGRLLVNIHGQNESQAFMQRQNQIKLLDTYAGLESEIADYQAAYAELRAVEGEIKSLTRDEGERVRITDMLKYQIAEIDVLKLKPGEEEKLTAEAARLRNSEMIAKNAAAAYQLLHAAERSTPATQLLERAASALSQLGDVIPEAGELAGRLLDYRYEIEDIAERAREFISEEDPAKVIDRIESRLDGINRLKRKYGGGIDEILAFRERAADDLERNTGAEDRIAELNAIRGDKAKHALAAAEIISEKRREAAERLCAEVLDTLIFLDMPKVRIKVEIERLDSAAADEDADSDASQSRITGAGEVTFGPDGIDRVEFLLAANPGEPLRPLASTASGGELSRVMLALKSVLAAGGAGTLIFDEIDAGISGKTSRKVGIKLRQIAEEAQVICVTHSAQIASLAGCHLFIKKVEIGGRTEVTITELETDERVEEIARIMGGITVTDAQRGAALEMLRGG